MVSESPELEALTRNVQRTFSEIIEQIPYLPEELQLAVTNIEDPSALGHLIAGSLRISTTEKQELLEEVDVAKRLRRLSEILARELEVIQLGSRIQSEVESEMEKGQREYYLREQLKAIQRELGEEDETQAEVNELRDRLEAAGLPEDARKAADRELSRLERLPAAAAEYGVIRTYLEWLVELPWSARTTDNLDLGHAREVLDADHYDLEEVKDRILEYLAVRSLNPTRTAPFSASSARPGSARPASANRSPAPSGESSSGSRSAASATSRDPRASPHLRRRHARDDRPLAARRRLAQPGADDRRDRQDGRGFPRRPVERDARGPRPGPKRRVPRSLPRPGVRPVRGDLHRDREQPRHDPGAAARPDGGDPARRLHDRREAPYRQALPGPATARRERAPRRGDPVRRRRAAGDHRRVHRARPGSAISSARSAPSVASSRARSPRAVRRHSASRRSRPSAPGSCSAAGASSRRPGGGPRTRGSRPGWPGPRSAARCFSSRRPRCRERGG